ncbi:hypothetical protein H4582DRAFT_2082006 [Lactarius indigo]|nr:hypothetical protein H4582DRAFT_2082006 [Lactarius indigo]
MSRGRVRLPGVALHTPIMHDDDPAQVLAPEGFRANQQPHYIHFPITRPNSIERNASHIQIVRGVNPFVLGLIPRSPHLYGKPLYAHPRLSAAGRAHIAHEDLVILASNKVMDCTLNHIGDESLTVEVTRYQAAVYEEERLATRIHQLQMMRLAARDDKMDCIYQLERADVFKRLSEEQSTWTARDFCPDPHCREYLAELDCELLSNDKLATPGESLGEQEGLVVNHAGEYFGLASDFSDYNNWTGYSDNRCDSNGVPHDSRRSIHGQLQSPNKVPGMDLDDNMDEELCGELEADKFNAEIECELELECKNANEPPIDEPVVDDSEKAALMDQEHYLDSLGDQTNPYTPFKSRTDWEIAQWAKM